MQFGRKIVSWLLTAALACTILAGCGGGGGSNTGTAPLPTAKFTYTANGLMVSFNGSGSSNADGTVPTFAWTFGDGGTSTVAKPIHVYTTAQSYTVTLTVTDEYGNSSSNQQMVTVSAANAVGLEPWTWVAGANTVDSGGTDGTKGVASAANEPGARQGAVSWTDAQGRLWLFGGQGYDSVAADGVLNDLWRFDPATQQWTWVNGAATANAYGSYGALGTAGANMPGARANAVQWTDTSGNLWLFGGNGYDSVGAIGNLNDMWMINPATGQATWIGGSNTANAAGSYGTQGTSAASNIPSARSYATSWTDKTGKFWLFGGQSLNATGAAGVTLNDLWMFDPSTKLWTWVAGPSAGSNAGGVYGTQGVASIANLPGARLSAQSWTDASGTLWLFGGSGYDSTGTGGMLNDMWSFNPISHTWTWVAGSKLAGAAGVYGTQGTAAAGVTPSGRLGAVGWIDSAGMLWLFGGGGVDSTGPGSGGDGGGELNDLWKFNPTTAQWAWVGGVGTDDSAGIYSTLGAASLYNTPGARVWSSAWVDASGNFWLFGGAGVDSKGNTGSLNDLWTVQLAP